MSRPFNLEEFKAGKLAVNRGNLQYRFVGIDHAGDLVVERVGDNYLSRRTPSGALQADSTNTADLVAMAPRKEKRWVVMRDRTEDLGHGAATLCSHAYLDAGAAQAYADMVNTAQIIEIEIEV